MILLFTMKMTNWRHLSSPWPRRKWTIPTRSPVNSSRGSVLPKITASLPSKPLPRPMTTVRVTMRVFTRLTKQSCVAPARWISTIFCCAPSRCSTSFDDARAAWQSRFRFIHVDEYQDTNRVQYDLLRLLAGENAQLLSLAMRTNPFTAGAAPTSATSCASPKISPAPACLRIEQNYRSRQKILDAAAAVVSQQCPPHRQATAGHPRRRHKPRIL